MSPSTHFEGIMVPLLVPLNDKEEPIVKDLQIHINDLIEKGVHGFLSPSASGEFANLSTESKKVMLQITVETVNNRVPVIALVGECGTKETLRNITYAQETGADAVMVQPPFYYPVAQQELKKHYLELAENSVLPVWIYHQPGDTKLQIKADLACTLAEHPNIAGIKISAGNDLYYYQHIYRLLNDKEGFQILVGEDHFMMPAFAIGGNGAIAFLSNIIPGEILALWNAVKKDDLTEARALQKTIMDCYDLVISNAAGSPQSIAKYILEKRGIFSTNHCSAPLKQLENSAKRNINREIVKLNLI